MFMTIVHFLRRSRQIYDFQIFENKEFDAVDC